MVSQFNEWEMVSEHHLPWHGFTKVWYSAILAGVAMLGIFIAVCFVPWKADQQFAGNVIVGVFIGSGLLLFLCPFVWFIKWKGVFVRVFVEGIEWGRRSNARRFPWKALSQVYLMDYHTGSPKLTDWNRHSKLSLIFDDGSATHFNHAWTQFDLLCESTQEASAVIHFPDAKDNLDKGEVCFGPVRLSRSGILLEKTWVPWDSIELFHLANGALFYKLQKGWKDISLADVPNYMVMVRLAESFGKPVRFGKYPPYAS